MARKAEALRLPLLTVFWLAIFTIALHAQQDSCLYRTLAVNVVTDDGKPVEGLSAQNFQGKLHGRALGIESAARDSGPRRIVLVLDVSGSMDVFRGIEILAARRFLWADPRSSAALITFSSQVDDKIDFAKGRGMISDKLAGLETPVNIRGLRRTALRDALDAALDLLRPVQFGDAIFLVSDGDDNASQMNRRDFTAHLLDAGARLFAFVPVSELSRFRPADDKVEDGVEWVRQLVTASGGDFASNTLDGDLVSMTTLKREGTYLTNSGQKIVSFATVGFAHEIDEPYRLTVRLPGELPKPHEWELRALDANGKVNNNWRVVYPQRLAACP
jgi:hypothetical protein